MMACILAWLIVSMLSLTGLGMAESNDETELRTVVRAMMTAHLNQNVDSASQRPVRARKWPFPSYAQGWRYRRRSLSIPRTAMP